MARKARKHILEGYKPHDKFFVVNDNDPDLDPITIKLPDPPPLPTIDGYGLPAKDQYFTRAKMPARLVALEERAVENLRQQELDNRQMTVTGQKILEETWRIFEKEKHNYKKEIEWIQKQIYYVLNGYWCYINGKPTYIDGWQYAYNNFWIMLDVTKNDGYPEYRDRDRRWFHFARYTYTTTEDENGVDVGFRTSFGFMYPKHRRDGATYKALCVGYFLTIFKRGAHAGIQSFDDSNAHEHYTEKLIPAWQALPFFFRPVWQGSNNPRGELNFKLPQGRAYGKALGAKISYATTSNRKFYDGKKLYYYQGEEEGKCVLEDIYERWGVVRPCLSTGDSALIHGFSIHPSTVADIIDQGGMNYYNLSEHSKFNERDESKHQTISGLFRLFIPAWDGLEGSIGPYGESIIEKPTPEQIAFTGRTDGAKHQIMSYRKILLDKGTPESKMEYRRQVMLFPITYGECFRGTSGGAGFDEQIIDTRIEELRRKNPAVPGNFEPEGGVKDARIIFTPCDNGRWEVTKQLSDKESNLQHMDTWYNPITEEDETVWTPTFPTKFTLGVDPFGFSTGGEAKKRQNKDRMSDGGGAVYWERDVLLDPGDVRSEYISETFVATYRYRPASDTEFAEDMLNAARYYGAMAFSENNISIINKHFIERGYAGYLKYSINEITGRQKDEPGYFMGGGTKVEMMNLLRSYIAFRGHKENHLSLLLECKSIKGIEFVTNFDLLAAAGAALMGSKSSYSKIIEKMQGNIDTNIASAFPIHRY